MSGRKLVVVADDFGIGPATSNGILRACRAGVVTGTVLLVNSPYAVEAVRVWQKAGVEADLGWHPCLTIDAPLLPTSLVPSLVTKKGRFPSLGQFMLRLATKQIRQRDIVAEFRAQLNRFRELAGHDPLVVNAHHHIHVFACVASALQTVLEDCRPRPFVRWVRESWTTLRTVPGARIKRVFLSTLGRWRVGNSFAHADALAGITDPPMVQDADFFARWLRKTPGATVELTCHPGEEDQSLLGRDAKPSDGHLERRVRELELLLAPQFRTTIQSAGFHLMRPSQIGSNEAVRRKAG